jgi:tetratricopeptide (TPR) repeat protein
MDQSPMAGVRALRGRVYADFATANEQSGDRAKAEGYLGKAFSDYYNVAVKYAASVWGARAAAEAGSLKDRLEGAPYNRTVNITLPSALAQQPAKVNPGLFRDADNLYRQKKWEESAGAYLTVLKRFPESDQTPRALARTLECFARLNRKYEVKAIAEYLSERLRDSPASATALLLGGKYYLQEAKDPGMYLYLYDLYFERFPRDERMPGVLFTVAQLRKKQGDEAGRQALLTRLVENYKDDKYYVRALRMLAWEQYAAGQYEEAIKSLALYIDRERPGPDKAKAQFALADAYSNVGDPVASIKQYTVLISWLDPKKKGNPFSATPAEAGENQETLEKAMLQRATTFSKIDTTAEKQKQLRVKALQLYDEILTLYPDSTVAPAVMAAKGTLLLMLNEFDAATATFEELSRKYPDSEQGKSSQFSMIRAAIESGQQDLARKAFGDMLANRAQYGPAEFLRVGGMMLELGAYAEAMQAYATIPEDAERRYSERALFGAGEAAVRAGTHEQAIPPLERLMEKYPLSGQFFDAKALLAVAYREAGRFDDAIEALKGIFQNTRDPVQKNEANYELAQIYLSQGDRGKAYAALQRVAMLADRSSPEGREVLEKCILQSISVGMELGFYDDVVEGCKVYLETFPGSEQEPTVRQARRNALRLARTQPEQPAEGTP